MKEKLQPLKSNIGLHARLAANFVRKASEFQSMIQIEYENKKISAKSLLGILSLNLSFDDNKSHEIKIIAEGPDEDVAVEELCALVENCFIPVNGSVNNDTLPNNNVAVDNGTV